VKIQTSVPFQENFTLKESFTRPKRKKSMDRFDRVFNSSLSIFGFLGWLVFMFRYWPGGSLEDRAFLICSGIVIPYLPWLTRKSNQHGKN
jgi:hypothetical protein